MNNSGRYLWTQSYPADIQNGECRELDFKNALWGIPSKIVFLITNIKTTAKII